MLSDASVGAEVIMVRYWLGLEVKKGSRMFGVSMYLSWIRTDDMVKEYKDLKIVKNFGVNIGSISMNEY